MRLLVTNARIYTPIGFVTGGLLAENGRIAAVGNSAMLAPADVTLDARGYLLLPGAIDLHAHISYEGDFSKETFASGTAACAAGGITTVVDMNHFSGCVTPQQYRKKIARGEREAVVDFGLAAGIVVREADLAHLPELAALGTPFFKVFMPVPGAPLDTGLLWRCLQAAAEAGIPAAVHAEDARLFINDFDGSRARNFALSRPAVAETSAVAALVEMSRASGARLHICHVSVARTAQIVAQARTEGVPVTMETCPHYLLFDVSELDRQGPIVKCTPPLRTPADREELWGALAAGDFAAWVTDHFFCRRAEKEEGWEDIRRAPGGMPALELSLALLHTFGVASGRIDWHRFVQLTAAGPAHLAGYWPRKGNLTPGADADFYLFDPDDIWTVPERPRFSKADFSPYAGMRLRGRVVATFVRGQQVYDGREITIEPGYGRYVAARALEKSPNF